jgi:hypothetical protein
VCAAVWLLASVLSRPAFAYSALTHEAIVDAAWDDAIKPLLLKKYAGTTEDELRTAHAYAYGGCIIQDMGYYPFGNELFTRLLHYVRTGDFVANLINDAEPIEEYAFALGALEHYVADVTGHPMATNVAVPLSNPKLRREFGSVATFEDDPTAHLQLEFGFDVLQVARGRYTPDAHNQFIGFAVSETVLQRAFYNTYGLMLRDLFANLDLAIGTYRHTVSQLIPEATKIAWEMKKDEIMRANPRTTREQFVYAPPPGSYEKQWDRLYERPSWLDTFLAALLRVVPKFGPLKALDVKPITPAAERLFVESFEATVTRYEAVLHTLGEQPLELADLNLDTGAQAQLGNYTLEDETYGTLVDELAERYFASVTPVLRDNIVAFYSHPQNRLARTRDEDDWEHTRAELAPLQATTAPAVAVSAQSAGAPFVSP